jgi:hypothetical protein
LNPVLDTAKRAAADTIAALRNALG